MPRPFGQGGLAPYPKEGLWAEEASDLTQVLTVALSWLLWGRDRLGGKVEAKGPGQRQLPRSKLAKMGARQGGGKE